MSDKPTLKEAFSEMPDKCHIGIYYDMHSNEWYVEFDQSPFRKQTYYDKTGTQTLPELIITSSKDWDEGSEPYEFPGDK